VPTLGNGHDTVTALVLFHIVAGAVLLALALQALLNARHVPRLGGGPPPSQCPRVAILVPARNEAARIAAAVRAWRRQTYALASIVVYDDASADATGTIAAEAGGGSVHVLRGAALPSGWRGKPHACQRLREATDAEILIFADADVVADASVVSAAVSALATLRADALSALPRHETAHLLIRTLVGLQNWAPLTCVPLWASALARRPRFTVVNGQFLTIRASAYDRAGGFAAVRHSLGEDTAFGRRLTGMGHVVALVDGSALLTCRAYESLGALWRAHVRNLRVAFFGSSLLMVSALATLAALVLAPIALLVTGMASGRAGTLLWTWLPLAEIVLALLPRALSDARAGYGILAAALHPLAVIMLFTMSLDAAARALTRRPITWRGRHYPMDGRAG
jgi:cellulose synthase/poly-beta-1,6-N-acetylglucosamine synthase-like glycosyltransferase